MVSGDQRDAEQAQETYRPGKVSHGQPPFLVSPNFRHAELDAGTEVSTEPHHRTARNLDCSEPKRPPLGCKADVVVVALIVLSRNADVLCEVVQFLRRVCDHVAHNHSSISSPEVVNVDCHAARLLSLCTAFRQTLHGAADRGVVDALVFLAELFLQQL